MRRESGIGCSSGSIKRVRGNRSKAGGAGQKQLVINRLRGITITPKAPVSMLSIKFPAEFARTQGEVSEGSGCGCDVYSDKFGLQYWLFAGDNGIAQKKGDVFWIIYGPPQK